MLHRRFFRRLLTLIALMIPLSLVSTAQASPLLDVVVLMDASSSLGPVDYLDQKNLVAQFYNSFTVGANANRFGLVQFGTSVQVVSGLSGDSLALQNDLNAAVQLEGNTNHGGALAMANTLLSTQGRGGDVQQVVVLLTDGNPNVSSGGHPNPAIDALLQADQLKNQGALVFTVGIGFGVDPGLLGAYASGPTASTVVSDFSGGSIAIDAVVDELNALPDPIAVTVDAPTPLGLMLLGLGILGWQRRGEFWRCGSALAA